MSDHLKHGAENKARHEELLEEALNWERQDYLSRLARWGASFEALSGITLTPLFLIGLTRRYLRTA